MVVITNKKAQFEQYYEEYYTQALRYTMKKISDRESAEDIVMDAFAACLRNFDSFDPKRAKFATWYYFVLNNKIKNFYRDHKEVEPLEEYPELSGDNGNEMEQAVHTGEQRAMLAKALKELPELQRRIVILKYFYYKDSGEIAQRCGMTPGNVRVQLSRALDKMKLFFEKNHMEWKI